MIKFKLALAKFFFNCYVYFLDISKRTVSIYPLNRTRKNKTIEETVTMLRKQGVLFNTFSNTCEFVKVLSVNMEKHSESGIVVEVLDSKNVIHVMDSSWFYTTKELEALLTGDLYAAKND